MRRFWKFKATDLIRSNDKRLPRPGIAFGRDFLSLTKEDIKSVENQPTIIIYTQITI